MKSSSRHETDRKTLLEQARESKENGYLLSAKKIGAGAFSKVYLAHALPDKVRHNYKLAADLRGKRHSMVAIKIISTAKAPLEYARKFLPREIYCLNATYKHGNVVSPSPAALCFGGGPRLHPPKHPRAPNPTAACPYSSPSRCGAAMLNRGSAGLRRVQQAPRYRRSLACKHLPGHR
ncbi:testis-specific serine/threonine-protein kinase 5-like [Alligator sinensis]|uniref:Testis-specific serine/threonine-protein kinase 5-like n=1 Tax=Alligator sinensis TaxID=38654 RepID=A0A3Q0HDG8_ALLSI|nr:testis-specific serine/threonine-protein kinase 5-like [Alligator sinensis]